MRRRGAGVGLAVFVTLTIATPAMAGTQGPTKSLGKAKGLNYRAATFPQVVSEAGADVSCKPDWFAIGGGGVVEGADGLSRLVSTSPNDVDLSNLASNWYSTGTSISGRDQTTYAICSKTGVAHVAGGGVFPPNAAPQVVNLACPSGRLISGGISNDPGNPAEILESMPVDGPDSNMVADDAWRIVGLNNGAGSSNTTIWVACSETAVLTYAKKTKSVPQASLGKPVAKCPNRYAVTGGGFEAGSGGNPSGLSPWDSKDKGKTPEDGWEARVYNASIDTLEITSTAICLRKL